MLRFNGRLVRMPDGEFGIHLTEISDMCADGAPSNWNEDFIRQIKPGDTLHIVGVDHDDDPLEKHLGREVELVAS